MRLRLIAAGKGTSEEMFLMLNEKVDALELNARSVPARWMAASTCLPSAGGQFRVVPAGHRALRRSLVKGSSIVLHVLWLWSVYLSPSTARRLLRHGREAGAQLKLRSKPPDAV